MNQIMRMPRLKPKPKSVSMSKSVREDFMVLIFIYAILQVSKMDNSDDDSVVKTENKYFKETKRILRRIETINGIILEVINEMHQIGGQSLHAWIRDNQRGRIDNTILSISKEEINLEYLALNILYVNFCDYRGTKTLFGPMDRIRELETNVVDTLELFTHTNIDVLTESSYDNAHLVIQKIKK